MLSHISRGHPTSVSSGTFIFEETQSRLAMAATRTCCLTLSCRAPRLPAKAKTAMSAAPAVGMDAAPLSKRP